MKLSIHSLPVRLSFWIGSVLLISLSITAVVLGMLWGRSLTRTLNNQGIDTVNRTAADLNRIFVQGEQAAGVVASMLEHNPPAPGELPQLLREALRAMNQKCGELAGIAIAYRENALESGRKYNLFVAYEKDAGYVCRRLTGKSSDIEYFFRDWFVVPLTLRKPVWTIPYQSEVREGTLIFSYSMPFYRTVEGERRSVGVVEVDIKVDDLAKFLDNSAMASLRALSPSGEIFLMNQFGQIVLYPGKKDVRAETIFTLCDGGENPLAKDRRAAQSIFKKPSSKISLDAVPALMNRSELFHASCVNGWVVGIVIPQDWKTPLLLPFFARFFAGTVIVLAVVIATIFIICSRLNRPLILLSQAAREVGQGNFAAPLPELRSDDEIGDLAGSFRQMQNALADYIVRLKETVAAHERSEGELHAAKAIQQDILPHILPPLPECRSLVCAADLIPARGVGGDLYDIFPVGQDHWALIIGDVSGKGVPAALFMAVTQTLQRSIAQTLQTPEAIVTQLNRMLSKDNTSEMFVTYWLGILDLRTGSLAFTNGGHNPPLLQHRDGRVELLKQRHGPMLGVVPARQYRSDTITLAPGDMLILYTDGVTEAFNAAEEMFGNDRLAETISAHRDCGPTEMLDAIQNAVFRHAGGFEQSDDITMLLLQYGRECLEVPAKPEELEKVITFFDEFPAGRRLSSRSRNLFRVGIEEVFANIVNHAYPGGGGMVTLRIREEGNRILMSFADGGSPFNPLEHPEPDLTVPLPERPVGGLGIHLIRNKMDFVEYQYQDGKNSLTIGKNCDESIN